MLLFLPLTLSADELRLDFVRHSLTATYRHYKRYVDGLEVVDGGVVERTAPDLRDLPVTAAARVGAAPDLALRVNGTLRRVRRSVVTDAPHRPFAEYRDASTGELLRRDPLFWNAKARVFEVNPVAKLNDPSLADHNNAASAVPDAAYSLVDLADDFTAGPLLAGPNVQIVDNDAPFTSAHATPSQLIFDRSQLQFEEVNAYFLIDNTLRYLQSLGYVGPRRLVAYPIPVDPHAVGGSDNSFYVSGDITGRGQLFFGDGGTDDAEDADIVLHEFMHSVQDWIAPGIFSGAPASQSRALSEAIADYWAFSSSYIQTVASGRDAACLGDWDARCAGDDASEQCGYPAGADCLRRVDSGKTMADYSFADLSGTEHRNGEIWSSAMREMFLALTSRYGLEAGKRLADTIVIESMFGTPPSPTFAYEARRVLESDRAVTGGANAAPICSAMTARGILAVGDCNLSPRGEVTLFQSPQHGIAIPDADPVGVESTLTIDDPRAIERLFVTVDVRHPIVADVQIVLTGPDGTSVTLQEASLSRSPATVVTFGRDAQPAQSLDVFRGRSARGTWKLRVSDVFANNVGTLVSWTLVVQFAGDQALASRPASAQHRFVPVVAHLNGANGSVFRTDLALLNRGGSTQDVMLVFTPSGEDGYAKFFAARVEAPSQQVVLLRDVVAQLFATAGSGSLEVQGDALTTTTLYNETAAGRLGETIEDAESTGNVLFPLPDDSNFRANVGITDTSGIGGLLRIGDKTIFLAPFSHLQFPAPGAFFAEVQALSPNLRFAAYVSMIDNRSGDATYFPAQPSVFAPEVAPIAGRTGGVGGTFWRTEVWQLPAFHSIDAVSGFGPVDSNSGAAFRIWTPCLGGTCGDRIPPRLTTDASAVGQDIDVFPIENSAQSRTNVGFSEVAGGSAIVRVTLFDSAGRELDSFERFIGARQNVQLPVSTPVVGARVRMRVVAGDGRILGYASVVDNASNDFVFVPAR